MNRESSKFETQSLGSLDDEYRKFNDYRGYRYLVRRTAVGTVCCYIDVEDCDVFRGCREMEDADKYIDVHGGVTYFQKGFPDGKGGYSSPAYTVYSDTIMDIGSQSTTVSKPETVSPQ